MKHIGKAGPGFTIGEFEQLVLIALVRLSPDASVSAIRHDIEARTGRDLAISAVYITLDRLEAKGFVKTRISDPTPQRGGRRKKHFTLLPAGKRAIAQVCRTFSLMVEGLDLA